MEKAYQKAKEGGYDGRLFSNKIGSEFYDPSFWKCLGKSLGWTGKCEGSFLDGFAHPSYKDCPMCKKAAWQNKWHEFIDFIAGGQSPDTFFSQLLNK